MAVAMGNMRQWGLTNQNTVNTGSNNYQQQQVPSAGYGQQRAGYQPPTVLGANGFSGNTLSENFLGGVDAQGNTFTGLAQPVLGAGLGLAESWLGFQNLGVAQDQLSFQKNAWQEQFNLQKEEYDYQKQRRSERQANYDASMAAGAAASPSNASMSNRGRNTSL